MAVPVGSKKGVSRHEPLARPPITRFAKPQMNPARPMFPVLPFGFGMKAWVLTSPRGVGSARRSTAMLAKAHFEEFRVLNIGVLQHGAYQRSSLRLFHVKARSVSMPPSKDTRFGVVWK